MPKVAKTVTLAATSGTVTVDLTEAYSFLNVTNLDATIKVWINYMGGAAVVEGDENICIRANETVVLRKTNTFTAIGESGTPKINLWTSDN